MRCAKYYALPNVLGRIGLWRSQSRRRCRRVNQANDHMERRSESSRDAERGADDRRLKCCARRGRAAAPLDFTINLVPRRRARVDFEAAYLANAATPVPKPVDMPGASGVPTRRRVFQPRTT